VVPAPTRNALILAPEDGVADTILPKAERR